MIKKFNELTFSDDFMFGKVLTTNKELCKELLELILGEKINRIEFVEEQRTLKQTYPSKGIRLDVYVKDDKNVAYDVEMQTTYSSDLPKRIRFYQGMIDLDLIESGDEYSNLKRSYIIFICLSDPFKKGLPVYVFTKTCKQDRSIELNDEATTVVINVSGSRKGLSPNMAAFLDFVQNQKVSDDFTQRLSDEVSNVRSCKKWSVEYMHVSAMLADARRDGIEQGVKQGVKQSIAKNVRRLLKFKMTDSDIINAIIEDYDLTAEQAEQYLLEAKKNIH